MPLNEASWAVVVICDRMPLNWLTRLLRTVCADASTTGAVAVVKVIALVSVPPIAPPESYGAEGRRSKLVGGGDRQLAGRVDRRGQIVGQQRGIELVEGLDRAVGAVAEGDVDRRTAIEGGEGQGLARQAAGRRGATRVEVGARPGVAGEAERRERVAGADDRQIGGRAGRDLQRARNRSTTRPGRCATAERGRTAGVRRGLDAGGKIDRRSACRRASPPCR